jgi:hypothetical protein
MLKIHTIEKILFMEISSKVQFTIKEVIIPKREPRILDRISEKVEEKYLNDFILVLIFKYNLFLLVQNFMFL